MWFSSSLSKSLRITPLSLVIDNNGNIKFVVTNNHRIRVVTLSTGIVNTYAGTGAAGYSGDGVAATSAALYYPQGLAIDTSGIQVSFNIEASITLSSYHFIGNFYLSDQYSHRIRKISSTSDIITTIVGSSAGFSGDGGAATLATLYNPIGVAVDISGISDAFFHLSHL